MISVRRNCPLLMPHLGKPDRETHQTELHWDSSGNITVKANTCLLLARTILSPITKTAS